MKYKSLLLDVDGTLVPVGPYTIPSAQVRSSIDSVRDSVAISLVSGRPIDWLKETFDTLHLTHPCVINGGSQIIDPVTHSILWEQPIHPDSLAAIMRVIHDFGITSFTINDDGVEHKNPKDHPIKKPLAIQLSYFSSKKESDDCIKQLQQIPNLSFHKFYSWDKNRDYSQEVYITHARANKQHAVSELVRMMGLHRDEIIAVGDSRNDIPLFDVCGLKVAMGNADDKLKLIADYVAPTVDEDGVADVIQKFLIRGEEIPKKKSILKNFFTQNPFRKFR